MDNKKSNVVDRTLVIIPAFNEEEAIGDVLEALRPANGLDVLVVDDGSRDGTADVARRFGVLVANLPFNLGVGGALRTGFRYAVRYGYARAIQFDADGQHEPSQISSLIKALDAGADLVIGSRFAHAENTYTVSRVRSGAMRLLRLTFMILSGHRFTDTSSGFRGFSREMLEFFAQKYPVEYMDSTESLLLACYAGFEVVEVPALMKDRQAGTPSTRNLHLIYHYLRLMVVVLSSMSLKGRRLRTQA